jgi:hypothetical protein
MIGTCAATRWGIPVESFAAGTLIMLDARPVIIEAG